MQIPVACGGVATGMAIYSVGQEIAAPAELYAGGLNTCQKQTATPTYKYFALTELAPTEFVEATEKVD